EAWRITMDANSSTFVVAANLGGRPTIVDLELGTYYYDGKLLEGATTLHLDPFQTVCLRRAQGAAIELLGTTSHLFPGLDIERFACDNRSISLTQFSAARLDGEALIAVPDASGPWLVDGIPAAVETLGPRTVLRVPVSSVAPRTVSGIL
ncbi:MAG: hypothetical protein ACPL2N_06280, partial [Candidatus Cryosericum sp.]